MFLGQIQCELELGKCHPAFQNLKFFLIEPQHEVDWKGSLIAVDTIDSEVGDWVLVAMPPFGRHIELPNDLPIQGAVVAIVEAIQMTEEDEAESQLVEEEKPRSRGGSRGRPRRDDDTAEKPRRRGRGSSDDDDAAPAKRGPRSSSSRSGAPKRAPRRSEGEDEEAPRKRPRRTSSEDDEPKRRPRKTESEAKPEEKAPSRSKSSGSDSEFGIVWDSPDSGGGSVKSKAPRRRR